MNGWVSSAFLTGLFATGLYGLHTQSRNRRAEERSLRFASQISGHEARWDVKHIRDDVGMLFGAFAITNGLLAAILTALLTR